MATDIVRPGLRIGVLGHARHGKSALASALTARAAARASARKTVPLAFVDAPPWRDRSPANGRVAAHRTFLVETSMRDYTGLDVSAHRRLIRHAGVVAASVDACVIVVSATEGAMPQTREHAVLARQLSPRGAVVFINRCDEVADAEQLDIAEVEARDALADAGFDGDDVVIVRGAARPAEAHGGHWGGALDDLLDALDHTVTDVARDVTGAVHATVLHRWKRVSAEGPVVELSVRAGQMRVGMSLSVLERSGTIIPARIGELRRFDDPVRILSAGEIGTALVRFDAAWPWIRRRSPRMGDLLFEQHPRAMTRRAIVRLQLLSPRQGGRHTPIRSGHHVSVWLGGRYVRARVVLPDGALDVTPGATRDNLTLELASPGWVPAGARFVLRDGSTGSQHGQVSGRLGWSGCFAVGEVLASLPD